MSSHSHEENLRVAVLSVVKHDYVPLGVIAHPRFQPVVVADDATEPEWVHQRNEELAAELGVPYVRDVERALSDFGAQVAVVSSQPERHCALSVRAANAGLHVVQDKPMSTRLSECDRLVEAVERNKVKFLMWNRNPMPAVLRARQEIESGTIGSPFAVHVDFYFASDQGPPKGSRRPEDKPINWLEAQIAAHPDGRDGGVGIEPMGELKIEGIDPLGYIRALTGADVERVFARTTAHFHQLHFDNGVEDLATVLKPVRVGSVRGAPPRRKDVDLAVGPPDRRTVPDSPTVSGEIEDAAAGSEVQGGRVHHAPIRHGLSEGSSGAGTPSQPTRCQGPEQGQGIRRS